MEGFSPLRDYKLSTPQRVANNSVLNNGHKVVVPKVHQVIWGTCTAFVWCR